MQNWIQRLFQAKPEPTDGLTQPQREAMIELLLLTMYADNRISLQEDDLIDSKLHQFDWESGIQPEYFLNQATQRIRAVIGHPEQEEKLLVSIREILATPKIRQQALLLCERLIESDQTTAPSESTFLAQVKQTLAN